MAAVTNCHQHVGSKQRNTVSLTVLLFKSVTGLQARRQQAAFLAGGFGGEPTSLLFLAVRSFHIPWLVVPPTTCKASMVASPPLTSASIITSPPTWPYCLPLIRDPCDYIGPTGQSRIISHLRILILITSAHFLWPCKANMHRFLGLGHSPLGGRD